MDREVNGHKRSSEIASAVFHRLTNTHFEPVCSVVHIFADGCRGQNKNTIMIGMLMKWIASVAPTTIQGIELFFPVAGYSFMPPDRVFGRIEKELKTTDPIITVQE